MRWSLSESSSLMSSILVSALDSTFTSSWIGMILFVSYCTLSAFCYITFFLVLGLDSMVESNRSVLSLVMFLRVFFFWMVTLLPSFKMST